MLSPTPRSPGEEPRPALGQPGTSQAQGKGPRTIVDWTTATERDLTNLIQNRTIENHYLDYKRRDSLLEPDNQKRRNELGKDVSSFAHADGGAMIYGMVETGQPGRADRLEGFTPKEMTQERLAQYIQTSTQPPGIPVHINPVELATSDAGKWAFVVTIPRADRAYQAYDHKYHRRDNTTTRTMNHDEIVDVMNRGPQLDLQFVFTNGEKQLDFRWAPEHGPRRPSPPFRLFPGDSRQRPPRPPRI